MASIFGLSRQYMRSLEPQTAPVQDASKHWDYMLVGRIYGQRSGKSEGGYLAGDQWDVKPGEMRAYNDLIKSALIPLYEKLLADGTMTSYGRRLSHGENGSGVLLLHNGRRSGIRQSE